MLLSLRRRSAGETYSISRHGRTHRHNQTGRPGAVPSPAHQTEAADLDALRWHSIRRRAIHIVWPQKVETGRRLLPLAWANLSETSPWCLDAQFRRRLET